MWFDLLLPGLDADGAPIPLGGTSNHFLTERAARARRLGSVQRHRGRRPRHPPAQGRLPHGDDRLDDATRRPTPTSATGSASARAGSRATSRPGSCTCATRCGCCAQIGFKRLHLVPADRRRHVHLPAQPDLLGADDGLLLVTQAGFIQDAVPGLRLLPRGAQLFIGNFVFIVPQRRRLACSAATSTSPSTRCSRRCYWGLMSIGGVEGLHPALHRTRSTGRRPSTGSTGAHEALQARATPAMSTTVEPAVVGRCRSSRRRPPAQAARVSSATGRRLAASALFLGSFSWLSRRSATRSTVVQHVDGASDGWSPVSPHAYFVWCNHPPKLAAIGFILAARLTTLVFLPWRRRSSRSRRRWRRCPLTSALFGGGDASRARPDGPPWSAMPCVRCATRCSRRLRGSTRCRSSTRRTA